MRALLVQPDQKQTIGFQQLGAMEPLGLEMIAGALSPAHEVDLLDLRMAPGTLAQTLDSFRPEIVGISSSFTVDIYRALRIAQAVKDTNPKTFVFVGGHHPSLCPHDFNTPAVDVIVQNEGEETAREMADCLAQGGDLTSVSGLILNTEEGQHSTGVRPLLKELDALPFPRRDLALSHGWVYKLITSGRIASLETARGCPYTCNFCSVWRFYQGRMRYKSPQRVIEELLPMEQEAVFLTDDNFLVDVPRAVEIGRLAKQHGITKQFIGQFRSDSIVRHPEVIAQWRELGLRDMIVGFEKPDQAGLQSVNKHNSVENNERALVILRANGIEPITTFIANPEYTHDDFAYLRGYIRRLKLQMPSFSILTPLPGTQFFDEMQDKLTTDDFEAWDIAHAVVPTRIPIEEFYAEFASLWRAAYPWWKLAIGELFLTYRGWRGVDDRAPQMRKVLREVRRLHDPGYYLAPPAGERPPAAGGSTPAAV